MPPPQGRWSLAACLLAAFVILQRLELEPGLLFSPSVEQLESGERLTLFTEEVAPGEATVVIFEDDPVAEGGGCEDGKGTTKVRMDELERLSSPRRWTVKR